MTDYTPIHGQPEQPEMQWQPPLPQPTPDPQPPRARWWQNSALLVTVPLITLGAGVGIGYALPHSSGHAATPKPLVSHAATTSASASSITVSGTLELNVGGDLYTTGDECYGTGGYSDIAEGAEVVISDDSGSTLDITHLLAGVASGPGTCDFDFNASVPAGKGFYGVTVTHRGTVKFAESEIAAPKLSLGS